MNEEKYTKIANTSTDKIIKDRFNVKNEILILEKKIKDINRRVDKLYEDKYNGLFEEEDFTRLYSKQIENRKQAEERIITIIVMLILCRNSIKFNNRRKWNNKKSNTKWNSI